MSQILNENCETCNRVQYYFPKHCWKYNVLHAGREYWLGEISHRPDFAAGSASFVAAAGTVVAVRYRPSHPETGNKFVFNFSKSTSKYMKRQIFSKLKSEFIKRQNFVPI